MAKKPKELNIPYYRKYGRGIVKTNKIGDTEAFNGVLYRLDRIIGNPKTGYARCIWEKVQSAKKR